MIATQTCRRQRKGVHYVLVVLILRCGNKANTNLPASRHPPSALFLLHFTNVTRLLYWQPGCLLTPLSCLDAPLHVLAILGFAYHRMGLFRDAEKQLASSLKTQPTIMACMLLAKVSPAETAVDRGRTEGDCLFLRVCNAE